MAGITDWQVEITVTSESFFRGMIVRKIYP